MNRPDIHKYFLKIAMDVASRSTCARRTDMGGVGCVLVNKHNHIIGTGYNGNAAGLPHCIDTPCPGASIKPGQGTGTCEAIHAEQNALLQCRDVQEITVAYITHSPCKTCVKLLLNTSCQEIYFLNLSSERHREALQLWSKAGRKSWLLP